MFVQSALGYFYSCVQSILEETALGAESRIAFSTLGIQIMVSGGSFWVVANEGS